MGTKNYIKRSRTYDRLYCLAVAFWANYHAEEPSIKQRRKADILADFKMSRGSNTACASALETQDSIPTIWDLKKSVDARRELAAIRKETRIQQDKDETPEDVVAQFNAIVRKHPWLVTDLQLKRAKGKPIRTFFND